MARKGENIYHRKDGRWEGRYIVGRRLNGKPSSALSMARITAKSNETLSCWNPNKWKKEERCRYLLYGNGSLSDWMEYWLEVLEKPYIKETTYYLYKRNIKKHLAPALGDMFLAKIMQQDIQKMVDQLKLLLAPSTLHGVCPSATRNILELP